MLTEKTRGGKSYYQTTPPPGGEFYALLRLATWTLRVRGTEPSLLEFLDAEIERIKEGGPA